MGDLGSKSLVYRQSHPTRGFSGFPPPPPKKKQKRPRSARISTPNPPPLCWPAWARRPAHAMQPGRSLRLNEVSGRRFGWFQSGRGCQAGGLRFSFIFFFFSGLTPLSSLNGKLLGTTHVQGLKVSFAFELLMSLFFKVPCDETNLPAVNESDTDEKEVQADKNHNRS